MVTPGWFRRGLVGNVTFVTQLNEREKEHEPLTVPARRVPARSIESNRGREQGKADAQGLRPAS